MAEKAENQKSEAALREERVLEFWNTNKIFEKSLKKTEGKKEFVFFEGPPTANGVPGTHHLEARSFKDAIPRYKTMQGYHVRRKGGWDTHGLPVELQVEKKLGLNSKKAIEEYGIDKFNKKCKESVWEYVDLWNKFTERVGYWVDQEDPYVTYHNTYIESVWSILKKVNEQKLLYKDYKVVPWCPRCGTALSSHELAQGYEDVKDLSVYAKFRLKGAPSKVEGKSPSAGSGRADKYLLAWTTTPWTLPGNVALAVGEDIDYVEAKVKGPNGDEILVLAKARLSILTEPYEIVAEHKGKEMVGMEYEPLYPYLKDNLPEKEKDKLPKAFKVYLADFVNTEDGTGIVHTAVMYGQDDFVLGTEMGLPKYHLVGLDGKFLPGTGIFEGRFVKDEDVAVDVIKDLAGRNLLFKKEKYEHSYPHCWRCHTPLIYYARDSWYIRMSDPKIKKEMIAENKKINWEPAHIRDGRFGEWLREIKDWAISRERYWGTPLPVWACKDCKKIEVCGSIEELKEKTKKSGNKYFMLRHGESEKNIANISNSSDIIPSPLTPTGEERIKKSAIELKKEKIDYIFVSPLLRTQQSAHLVAEILGIPGDKIITDNRLNEVNTGEFDGKPIEEYESFFTSNEERFVRAPKGGENMLDVKKRVGDFIYEVDKKFVDKNILIISHEDTIWMLESANAGLTDNQSLYSPANDAIKMGELRSLYFSPLPHNENYEIDLHRPYIDEISLVCECGGDLVRTKEVIDVWFDSGAMPFAQDHYPFENKKWVDGHGFPADYICEAIDQTRGWFYTLHAVGVLMGRGKAFKNVICLGHLLDAKGKKMSKSIGNVVDPWAMMDKYGVDTLRLWMYSVNQPGESKNFDEKTVQLMQGQVFGLLYNVLVFYELYRDESLEIEAHKLHPSHILDQWIISRLNELVEFSTDSLDNYKLLEPTRAIRDFIGDLSTWYLRRSRERIKDKDVAVSGEALQTLYLVLKTMSKLIAPLAPFSAEDIWLKLRLSTDLESVHLVEWPKVGKIDKEVIEQMENVRNVVTLGLEARQKAGIKVRQPLSRLEVKNHDLKKEYIELIKDEINVKEVTKNKNLESDVALDVVITEELKQEGIYRELVRALQDLRKKNGLTPNEEVALTFETDKDGENLVKKFEADMKKTVLVTKINFHNNDGDEVKVDELLFKVKIEKFNI